MAVPMGSGIFVLIILVPIVAIALIGGMMGGFIVSNSNANPLPTNVTIEK